MIPQPSKRSFGHPLSAEALAFFCHPRTPVFQTPVRHAGGVYAASGWAAVRVTRGPLVHDDTLPPAPEGFAARVDALPWGRLQHDPKLLRQPPWRAFDDIRGLLYRGDLLPLWPGGRFTGEKPVWTGEAMFLPLALLQLLARLPKCEARIDGNPDFLCIRFSGGEGLIPARWRYARPQDVPPPVLSVFKPQAPGLPGGLMKF